MPFSLAPPPPKQPQSIEMPCAHTHEMPMMNATMVSAPSQAATRVNNPSTNSRPMTTSITGRA